MSCTTYQLGEVHGEPPLLILCLGEVHGEPPLLILSLGEVHGEPPLLIFCIILAKQSYVLFCTSNGIIANRGVVALVHRSRCNLFSGGCGCCRLIAAALFLLHENSNRNHSVVLHYQLITYLPHLSQVTDVCLCQATGTWLFIASQICALYAD